VGDMKRQELSSQAEPAFFIPFSQHPDETICFVARTQVDPLEALPLMRDAVRSVDPGLVVKNTTTVASLVVQSVSEQRYGTLLMNAFAILAALLAGAGVIGVTARRVSLRTRELGIKMALGARETGLVKATVGGNLRIALGGTALGVIGAFWASRLLSGFLFGIEITDPVTYAFVTASILILTLGASYFPARRISRVNPMDVLRTD
jgi:putative ABC transport system permease protein